jgi:hypothetical protein
MAGYATLAEAKARMQKTDTDADDFLPMIIDAASRAIDNFCNRSQDGFEASDQAVIRYFTGNGRSVLLIDECVEITAVAVKDAATDTAYTAWNSPTTNLAGDGDWLAFTGDLENPDFNTLPYDALMVDINGDHNTFTSGRFLGLRGFRPEGDASRNMPTVRVTAKWGYAINAPMAIKEACIMQVIRWYKREQGAMASALASAELGTLELFRTLDPDFEFILALGRYVKPATGRR